MGNFWLHAFQWQVRFSSWVCCDADVAVVVVEAGVLDCDEVLADEAWAAAPWS